MSDNEDRWVTEYKPEAPTGTGGRVNGGMMSPGRKPRGILEFIGRMQEVPVAEPVADMRRDSGSGLVNSVYSDHVVNDRWESAFSSRHSNMRRESGLTLPVPDTPLLAPVLDMREESVSGQESRRISPSKGKEILNEFDEWKRQKMALFNKLVGAGIHSKVMSPPRERLEPPDEIQEERAVKEIVLLPPEPQRQLVSPKRRTRASPVPPQPARMMRSPAPPMPKKCRLSPVPTMTASVPRRPERPPRLSPVPSSFTADSDDPLSTPTVYTEPNYYETAPTQKSLRISPVPSDAQRVSPASETTLDPPPPSPLSTKRQPTDKQTAATASNTSFSEAENEMRSEILFLEIQSHNSGFVKLTELSSQAKKLSSKSSVPLHRSSQASKSDQEEASDSPKRSHSPRPPLSPRTRLETGSQSVCGVSDTLSSTSLEQCENARASCSSELSSSQPTLHASCSSREPPQQLQQSVSMMQSDVQTAASVVSALSSHTSQHFMQEVSPQSSVVQPQQLQETLMSFTNHSQASQQSLQASLHEHKQSTLQPVQSESSVQPSVQSSMPPSMFEQATVSGSGRQVQQETSVPAHQSVQQELSVQAPQSSQHAVASQQVPQQASRTQSEGVVQQVSQHMGTSDQSVPSHVSGQETLTWHTLQASQAMQAPQSQLSKQPSEQTSQDSGQLVQPQMSLPSSHASHPMQSLQSSRAQVPTHNSSPVLHSQPHQQMSQQLQLLTQCESQTSEASQMQASQVASHESLSQLMQQEAQSVHASLSLQASQELQNSYKSQPVQDSSQWPSQASQQQISQQLVHAQASQPTQQELYVQSSQDSQPQVLSQLPSEMHSSIRASQQLHVETPQVSQLQANPSSAAHQPIAPSLVSSHADSQRSMVQSQQSAPVTLQASQHTAVQSEQMPQYNTVPSMSQQSHTSYPASLVQQTPPLHASQASMPDPKDASRCVVFSQQSSQQQSSQPQSVPLPTTQHSQPLQGSQQVSQPQSVHSSQSSHQPVSQQAGSMQASSVARQPTTLISHASSHPSVQAQHSLQSTPSASQPPQVPLQLVQQPSQSAPSTMHGSIEASQQSLLQPPHSLARFSAHTPSAPSVSSPACSQQSLLQSGHQTSQPSSQPQLPAQMGQQASLQGSLQTSQQLEERVSQPQASPSSAAHQPIAPPPTSSHAGSQRSVVHSQQSESPASQHIQNSVQSQHVPRDQPSQQLQDTPSAQLLDEMMRQGSHSGIQLRHDALRQSVPQLSASQHSRPSTELNTKESHTHVPQQQSTVTVTREHSEHDNEEHTSMPCERKSSKMSSNTLEVSGVGLGQLEQPQGFPCVETLDKNSDPVLGLAAPANSFLIKGEISKRGGIKAGHVASVGSGSTQESGAASMRKSFTSGGTYFEERQQQSVVQTSQGRDMQTETDNFFTLSRTEEPVSRPMAIVSRSTAVPGRNSLGKMDSMPSSMVSPVSECSYREFLSLPEEEVNNIISESASPAEVLMWLKRWDNGVFSGIADSFKGLSGRLLHALSKDDLMRRSPTLGDALYAALKGGNRSQKRAPLSNLSSNDETSISLASRWSAFGSIKTDTPHEPRSFHHHCISPTRPLSVASVTSPIENTMRMINCMRSFEIM